VDRIEADSRLHGHVSDVTVLGIVAQVYTVGWLNNGIYSRCVLRGSDQYLLDCGCFSRHLQSQPHKSSVLKNATPFTLEHKYDNFSEATAVATHEDDLFVSGFYTYKTVAWGSVGHEPVYWINGTITRVLPVIQTGGDYGGVAKDIFAVD